MVWEEEWCGVGGGVVWCGGRSGVGGKGRIEGVVGGEDWGVIGGVEDGSRRMTLT